MQGSEPPEYPSTPEPPAGQTAEAPRYGVDPALALVEIAVDEGIERANVNAFSQGLYVAAFEHSGGFEATDVLAKRFFRGDARIAAGDLQRQVCEHIERDRLRFADDDRNRVLRQLFDDAKLVGYIARLADVCIALDLSRRPGCTGARVPEVAARFMVRTAIEDLQRHASDRGAGGVGLVVKESTAEMIECINILDHEDICAVVPGADIIERIVWLTRHDQRPTAEEARQTMTAGSVGRRLFIELAKEVDQLDTIADGEVETICGLAMEYQFTKGSIGTDVDEVAGPGRRAADEAADEHGRKVIYFRGRGAE
jgi:hypothetical protein